MMSSWGQSKLLSFTTSRSSGRYCPRSGLASSAHRSLRRRGEGIGRLLLSTLVLEAQQRGIEEISLSVEADNPAMFLYADFGFAEVCRVADSPTMVLDCRTR